MSQITNDTEFKQALHGLNYAEQRHVAALIVEHVLPLCNDERLKHVVEVAKKTTASDDELALALKSAKATTFDKHARCGAQGNWKDQAGYFVARASVAALTPETQSKKGGPAWRAAMSSRMAQTSAEIDSDDDSLADHEWQYDLLSDYLSQ